MKTRETWRVKRVFSPRNPTGIYEVRSDDGRLLAATPARHTAYRIAAAPELLVVAKGARDLLAVLTPIMTLLDDVSATKYGPGLTEITTTINAVIMKAEGEGTWDEE